MNLLLSPYRTTVPSICVILLFGNLLQAQESPDDSLRSLRPAEGIDVSVWASEPMVNNPTSIDIDSRGRVWIAEGLNYRMKQRTFDDLDRVQNADRIKILSDTNGDGKADTVTVFADNIFPVPLGLAVEEIQVDGKRTGTRVYIGHSPDLLVLEDTDGDDKADRRYALLTGFRGVDSDHGLHGMTFGPDGKLYFTVGDTRYGADKVQSHEPTFDVTDKSGRRLSCSNFGTTLRVNRDGTHLEVLSSGHRNNYGAAVDSFGSVFGSDNDDDGNRGARLYWVMDGGRYGYQHPNSSRHWAEELPGIIPKLVGTGNGAPGGLIVYEGLLLPEHYFGSVLQVDSGTHQVNAHPLQRHGAGFRSDYEVLLKGDDSWFRPVDLAVAPDGSVLVCDWYDAGVGGNRFSDQTTGRIYRLTSTTESKAGTTSVNQSQLSASNPIAALQSPNETTRLAARDQLVAQGAAGRAGLLALFHDSPAHIRTRALHVLSRLPQSGMSDTIAALRDSDPRIRKTALQLLARDVGRECVVEPIQGQMDDPAAMLWLDQILPLADDPDAGVRRALLMALRNVPTDVVAEPLNQLAALWDGRDRYYLEAVRSALHSREPQFVQQLFDTLAIQALAHGWDDQSVAVPPYYPIGTNDAFLRPEDRLPPSNAASRVIGLAWALQSGRSLPALTRILNANRSPTIDDAATIALAGIDDPGAGQLLMQRYFAAAVDENRKRAILQRLGEGVSGPWKDLAQNDALQTVFAAALQDSSLQIDAIQSIARSRLVGFAGQFMELAQDESSSVLVRAAAVTALGEFRHTAARTLVAELVDHARGRASGGPLALAAIDASHLLVGPDTDDFLVSVLVDSNMPLDVRRRSLQLVTASVEDAEKILSLHKKEVLPTELHSELSFLLHNHADGRVRRMAAEVLPITSSGEPSRIHNVQAVLALQGKAARGRKLFETHKDAACARCHRVTGEGTLVGPDLASIGMKYGDKELLYHLQYPSGAINFNFVARTFVLNDGRVLSGLLIDRADGQMTIGIATGQHLTFAASDVDEEQPQTTSLMPEGLVAEFTKQQLSDLVEYLLTLRQGDAVSRQPPAGDNQQR